MRQLASLQDHLSHYQHQLQEKERVIAELRSHPVATPTPAPRRASSPCAPGNVVLGVMAMVVGVVAFAYLFLWKTERKVSPI